MEKRNLTKVFMSLLSIIAVLTVVGANMCVNAIKNNGIAACKFEPTESTVSNDLKFDTEDYKETEYSEILNINTEEVNKNDDAHDVGDVESVSESTPFVDVVEEPTQDESSFIPDVSVSEDEKENMEIEKEEIVESNNNVIVNTEPLKLVGGYASIDRSAYTTEESALLDTILSKINEYRTNPEVIDEKIPLNGMFDYESYCKISSYFYVYYGQKRAVDETFDLVNATREDGYLQLRYDDIDVFEVERMANQSKIDSILSTFTTGSEEHILKQISEYLAKNIVYTDGYYDLSSALSGKSVCNGYALAFNAMANRAGIKSDMCIGRAGGSYHAWNRVTLSDGSYRFYDITFYDSNGQNKYLNSTTSFHGEYLINDYTDCWFQR